MFSPLAAMSRRIPDGGRSSARTSRITGVGVHHNAGVDAYGEATNPKRVVSANYWITDAGVIIPQIDESRRAWTSGKTGYPKGAAADHRNVTIEVSNSKQGVKDGTWAISPAARLALVNLIADIHIRHKLGPVRRSATAGVGVHKDWVNTSCPGPYVMAQLPSIIAEAETIRAAAFGGTQKPPAPTPTPDPAVLAYQRRQNAHAHANLLPDGIDGPKTRAWRAWVTAAQNALNGFKVTWPRKKLVPDGDYGSTTAAYVKDVQGRNGLYRDGILGPVMIAWMRAKGATIPNRP